MRSRHLLMSAAGVVIVLAAPAQGDTLREALARTYVGNPTIAASRAQIRTLDESVNVARAQNRPQVAATGGLNQDLTRTGGGAGRNLNLGVDISYPLFNGGRVRNAIRAADTRVEAGRAGLRAVEGDVFTEAVGAYMDVIRDRSVVSLNENQVRVLTTNLEATRDRFEVGDLTRTDVAQSEARLALARSQLATAQGRLTGSEQNYQRVVGTAPDSLAPPPPLPVLPGTPDQAVGIALANNPDLVSINAQVRAAALDVQIQRANRLPTVSAIGSGRATNYLGTAGDQFAPGTSNTQTQTGLGVQARIPIYQGGLVGAQVRQAQSLQGQLLEQGVGLERLIVAQTRSAFATYQASQDAIQSNEVAVAANTLALEGARLENTVGTRTVLEVLNAEQELLNSQVLLVTARRDAYVAGFALLNAMGRAESRDLGLEGGALYDPTTNYERVSTRRSDWDQSETPAATSTRTVPDGTPSGLTGPPPPSSPTQPGTVTDAPN